MTKNVSKSELITLLCEDLPEEAGFVVVGDDTGSILFSLQFEV
ncbi:hypothetical protein thalar_03064 [Litoreibacter arenae DSM 19593]|uniref:Uncharacterized protein n=1 Tax=Litoreibacter arenae DSM 19593 TaxID=1123360 RepID=S9QBJ1_9RHOB|nr:hypothetical protein thalar_03064 [Litoreibacter arenae DSM 19593]